MYGISNSNIEWVEHEKKDVGVSSEKNADVGARRTIY
jgi:hypothetical protein